MPTRVGLLSVGSSSITLETWIGPSFSMMPPASPPFCVSLIDRGRWWRLTMFRPSTKTRALPGSVRRTRPVLPRSLPPVTSTVSSFRIFIAFAIELKNLWCEGDDLHEVAVAELAGHRAEDAGSTGVLLRVDQNGRVLVEGDVRPVGAPELLLGSDDHRLNHLALAHAAMRRRLLDGSGDHVAHARVAAVVPALNADDEDLARARVVGDAKLCLLLDHQAAPDLERSTTSRSRQRLVRERGRDSTTRTTSPS